MLLDRAMRALEPQDDSDRRLGALSYVLTWVTGVLVLLFAGRERSYARWNAIQAIGVGVLGVLAVSVASLVHLLALYVLAGGQMPESVGASQAVLPVPFVFSWGWVPQIGNLVVLIVGLYLALRAARGRPARIPVLADLADEHA